MLYHRHSLALSASVDRRSTAFITPRFSTPSSRVYERQQRKHTWLFVTCKPLICSDSYSYSVSYGTFHEFELAGMSGGGGDAQGDRCPTFLAAFVMTNPRYSKPQRDLFSHPLPNGKCFFLFFLCLNLTISGHDKRLKTEPKGRCSSGNMHCQHLFRWLQVFSQKKLLWGAAKRQTTVTPPSLTQNNHSTYSILVARVLKALTTHTCESADILHEINLSVAAVVCI